MTSIFKDLDMNFDPWDESSVMYEGRAKPIMNRRFDVVEKQTDYRAQVIEDSLENHKRDNRRIQQEADDEEIEALIQSIQNLEKKASESQKAKAIDASKAWQHQANAKKERYKDLTGVDWGTV